MPAQDGAEDRGHGRVVERVDDDHVEVAAKPRRDRVAGSGRRAHRAHNPHVL